MDKPESYEVTEYSDESSEFDKFSVIKQIIADKKSENPACAIMVSFVNNKLKLVYHTYEMHVPSKIKLIESQANDAMNDAIKYIKKEYKTRVHKTLTLKEDKKLADYTVQKVSLNERYYAIYWRFYKMS